LGSKAQNTETSTRNHPSEKERKSITPMESKTKLKKRGARGLRKTGEQRPLLGAIRENSQREF